MARWVGIGKDSVARIWADHNLKPWKVDTFKLSADPRFEEKLVDVVGLYMNPPERAAVFSIDEKTQCQALERTQPSLPMVRGRAQTMTHDYKRNATTDLFAALNVGTGEVLTECRSGHSAREVLAFFKRIDRSVLRHLAVHVILDNLSTHKAPKSPTGWPIYAAPAGTCTSPPPARRGVTSSNAGSKELTDRRLRRGVFASVTGSSTRSPTGPGTGITIPRHSSGTRQPRKSSTRSNEDGPRCHKSNSRRTTSQHRVTWARMRSSLRW
jgi:hypothetical protein